MQGRKARPKSHSEAGVQLSASQLDGFPALQTAAAQLGR